MLNFDRLLRNGFCLTDPKIVSIYSLIINHRLGQQMINLINADNQQANGN